MDVRVAFGVSAAPQIATQETQPQSAVGVAAGRAGKGRLGLEVGAGHTTAARHGAAREPTTSTGNHARHTHVDPFDAERTGGDLL